MAKAKLDRPRKKTRVMSVNAAQHKEFPTTHWAYAVAMLSAMKKPVAPESNKPLPEDFSADDFDVIRARSLSKLI